MGSLLALNAVIIGIQVVPWWWGFGHVTDGVRHQRFLMGVYAHPYPYKLRICRIFKLNQAWRRNIHFIPNRYNHHLLSWNKKRSEKTTSQLESFMKTYPFATYADLFPYNQKSPKISTHSPTAWSLVTQDLVSKDPSPWPRYFYGSGCRHCEVSWCCTMIYVYIL